MGKHDLLIKGDILPSNPKHPRSGSLEVRSGRAEVGGEDLLYSIADNENLFNSISNFNITYNAFIFLALSDY